MARMMTRIIFLCSHAPCLPCSMLHTCRAPCLPCSMLHAPCSMLHAPCSMLAMLHACRAPMLYACHAPMFHTCRAPCSMLYACHAPCLPCSMRHAPCLPCSMRRAPCSMLILSATGIMGYPTIIPYHGMIPVKSHTIGYPIPIFISYLFERYNIEYPIEYTISFRYVFIDFIELLFLIIV